MLCLLTRTLTELSVRLSVVAKLKCASCSLAQKSSHIVINTIMVEAACKHL